jgi:hypothetical protein
MALRKSTFFFDNSSGTLTDYSSDLNSVQLTESKEVLDDTGLNDDYQQNANVGLRSGTLALNGYIRSGNTGILKALEAAIGTSVTKTWQWQRGGRYRNGEGIVDGITYGAADGRGLILFSCNIITDSTINNTSVAL